MQEFLEQLDLCASEVAKAIASARSDGNADPVEADAFLAELSATLQIMRDRVEEERGKRQLRERRSRRWPR